SHNESRRLFKFWERQLLLQVEVSRGPEALPVSAGVIIQRKKKPLQAAAANRDVRSRSFKIYVSAPRRPERRGGEPFMPASE
ncbi:hypothetical protein, partial [Pseudomonas juntendi]|uniref:hypothetical protein n=1 Tax=Pseudomonas juntendi TaxID=2666183 RepID=UPI003B92B2E5